MEALKAYDLTDPEKLASNAVFSSPHSGCDYPPEFVAASRLDLLALRASEDALVDKLFATAPDHGAPLLTARMPRAWLDLNRAPSELDPALIDGVRAHGLNQRVAAGLGVVPRVVSEGQAIYDGKIDRADALARIAQVHEPYHRELERLLVRARAEFGAALLFDCHSMPTEALRAAPRVRGRFPEIVLGDRFGAAAGRAAMALTQSAFERAGFAVVRNAPFAGGYITQRYGRPQRGFHAIQIEIDRGLYLDQANVAPGPEFDAVTAVIGEVVAELAAVLSGLSSLAAE